MTLDKNIENIAEKLNVDIDWLREISPQEILYLVDRCPFLQIVTADPEIYGQEVEILSAKTDWKIHFYGDAMSSSPGELLFNEAIHGKGTIFKQAWDTSVEMLEIARDHQWKNITAADGHPLMLRALWINAEKMGLNVIGFTPSRIDWNVRARLALSSNDFEVLYKQIHQNSPSA